MDQAAHHAFMLERQQALEEALTRAESGAGTTEDWDLIRAECGLSRNRSESCHS